MTPNPEMVPVELDADTARIVDNLPKDVTPMRKAETVVPPAPKVTERKFMLKSSDYKAAQSVLNPTPKPEKKYEDLTVRDLERMEAAEAKRQRRGNR